MSVVGRWLGIESYKHDGALHRVWDRGYVLENSHDFIISASRRAKVVENNGRSWFTKEPAITIFSKRECWNVICMIKSDGVCFYCNIASPSLIDRDIIKYIDYDLDAKLFPNGEVRVLDEKEYDHHRESYGYDDELDQILKFTISDILERMKKRKFPFNEEVVRDFYNQFVEQNSKKE